MAQPGSYSYKIKSDSRGDIVIAGETTIDDLVVGTETITGIVDFDNDVTIQDDHDLVLDKGNDGSVQTTISQGSISSSVTLTLPDHSGTLATTDDLAADATIYTADGSWTGTRSLVATLDDSGDTDDYGALEISCYDDESNNYDEASRLKLFSSEVILEWEDGDGFGGTDGKASLKFDANGAVLTDSLLGHGFKYASDYSSQYQDRSLVDKGYVSGLFSAIPSSDYSITGTWAFDSSSLVINDGSYDSTFETNSSQASDITLTLPEASGTLALADDVTEEIAMSVKDSQDIFLSLTSSDTSDNTFNTNGEDLSNTTSPASKVVIREDGEVDLVGAMVLVSNSNVTDTDNFYLHLIKNGSEAAYVKANITEASGSNLTKFTFSSASGNLSVSSGDYIEFKLSGGTSSSTNIPRQVTDAVLSVTKGA